MRVIYSVSHLADWIQIATNLKNRCNWQPVYWLTSIPNHELVKDAFPNVIRHKYAEVLQCINPPEVNLFEPYPIDNHLMAKYSVELDIALKMMDRLDADNNFSYSDRRRFFFKLLNYAYQIIDRIKPELVIFNEIPHHVAQYALYVVCKNESVRIIMFKPFYLGQLRLLIYSNISEDPIKDLELPLQHLKSSHYDDIQSYMNTLKLDYTNAEPAYMKQQRLTAKPVNTFLRAAINICQRFFLLRKGKTESKTNVLKIKGYRLEDKVPSQNHIYLNLLKGSIAKRKLRNAYDTLSDRDFNLNKKYIYFPLHYQPERTTSPDAGLYFDQYLIIKLLRSVIPDDVLVYVKEHSTQFHIKFEGHMGRSIEDYNDLLSLPGVVLVPINFSSFKLIDHSICVATATGVVGIEAIARKKPVIVFGEGCYYKSLKGLYYYKDVSSLKSYLDLILQGKVFISEEQLFNFLVELNAKSFVGRLTPTSAIKLSENENVTNFTNAIINYANQKNMISTGINE